MKKTPKKLSCREIRKRFQNLVRAVIESPKPDAFDMRCFTDTYSNDGANWCGTPGCVIGHWAFRPDLQTACKIVQKDPTYAWTDQYADIVSQKDRSFNLVDDVLAYFGINHIQWETLFDTDGCGGAKTPQEAAKFIVKWWKKEYGDDLFPVAKG